MKKPARKPRKFIFDREWLMMLERRLKEPRFEKVFTQEEIAHQSGRTLSQIARIETIKTNPTTSKIFMIARTMNIELTDRFKFQLNDRE